MTSSRNTKTPPRAAAAQALVQICINGRSLSRELPLHLRAINDARDRAFVQELVYGVTRWYWRLRAQLQFLQHHPMRKRDADVEMLVLVGLYQLRHLSTPPHAAVAATVDASAGLGKSWAKKLINATLRQALRRENELAEILAGSEVAQTAHPAWLVARLRADWPTQYAEICTVNNARPPLTIRVNPRRQTRESYLDLLRDVDIAAATTKYSPNGIRVREPIAAEALPEFGSGSVSIQDEAAQLARGVLQLESSQRVLDACAAPGGKAAHILESADKIGLVALDRAPQRLAKLEATLKRLALRAQTKCADAAAVSTWWDGSRFDRILLDAPCSGSGVIRRRPDIKIHRRADDVSELVHQQLRLLESLWPTLNSGGKLVYCTCSVFRAENDAVIRRFVDETQDARLDDINGKWGIRTCCGRQILCGDHDMDGFYYARIVKT